jgi:alkane 1-monooxygenase
MKTKYQYALLLPIFFIISALNSTNIFCFSFVFYLFVYAPIAESRSKEDTSTRYVYSNKYLDSFISNMGLLHIFITAYSFVCLCFYKLELWQFIVYSINIGLYNASVGLTIAHELGHRSNVYQKTISNVILSMCMYNHFNIEHYKGHHRRVATIEDSTTARYGENLYSFWFRHFFQGYFSAYKLDGGGFVKNKVVHYAILNTIALYLLYSISHFILIAFVIQSVVAILFFQTISYIEHYGLKRVKVGDKYERISQFHSWDCNNSSSRYVLFDLPRHSHHHMNEARRYYQLEHIPGAPEMPYGYMTMVLLAMAPPLWFKKMNALIKTNAILNLAKSSSDVSSIKI